MRLFGLKNVVNTKISFRPFSVSSDIPTSWRVLGRNDTQYNPLKYKPLPGEGLVIFNHQNVLKRAKFSLVYKKTFLFYYNELTSAEKECMQWLYYKRLDGAEADAEQVKFLSNLYEKNLNADINEVVTENNSIYFSNSDGSHEYFDVEIRLLRSPSQKKSLNTSNALNTSNDAAVVSEKRMTLDEANEKGDVPDFFETQDASILGNQILNANEKGNIDNLFEKTGVSNIGKQALKINEKGNIENLFEETSFSSIAKRTLDANEENWHKIFEDDEPGSLSKTARNHSVFFEASSDDFDLVSSISDAFGSSSSSSDSSSWFSFGGDD